MDPENVTRAIIAAVAFVSLLAAHYGGDQWVQTSDQAGKKSLDRPGVDKRDAHWHCAKHVATYTATGVAFFLMASLWLDLPVRPGWAVAGFALNAATHYLVDLRTPLLWIARKLGRMGYIDHCQVVRPSGPEKSGPGTGMFHLDQAWHFMWMLPSALLIAGS